MKKKYHKIRWSNTKINKISTNNFFRPAHNLQDNKQQQPKNKKKITQENQKWQPQQQQQQQQHKKCYIKKKYPWHGRKKCTAVFFDWDEGNE